MSNVTSLALSSGPVTQPWVTWKICHFHSVGTDNIATTKQLMGIFYGTYFVYTLPAVDYVIRAPCILAILEPLSRNRPRIIRNWSLLEQRGKILVYGNLLRFLTFHESQGKLWTIGNIPVHFCPYLAEFSSESIHNSFQNNYALPETVPSGPQRYSLHSVGIQGASLLLSKLNRK